jgi:trigger factor
MKTKVEDISSVQKKVTVAVEAERVDEKIDKAYRALRKRAKIPGFRPGKAPRTILERHYGAQVAEDVTRDLINDTLLRAAEENNVIPLTMPVIENALVKQGKEFEYSAMMEVRPDFDLDSYNNLSLEKEMCHVTDEQVEKELEEVRKAQGQLQALEEDRGVQDGDYVTIDYEAFDGDLPVDGLTSANYLVRVGSGDFHPDFERALIGLKAGDRAEAKVDFAADHHHSQLAGRTLLFKGTIKSIKTLLVPELDDDFAKGLGSEFGNLDALKSKIRENLVKREESRIDQGVKNQLLEQLSSQVEFDLPECLVKFEIDTALRSVKENLKRSGSSLEKTGLDEAKIREDMRPASERRVRNMLILEKIAEKEALKVNEKDLENGFKKAAEGMGQDPKMVRQYYEANQLMDSFKQKLLEEKTLNYLLDDANISEVEAQS